MRSFSIFAVIGLILGGLAATSQARADAQLLMIEEAWCEWCEQWNADIGHVYDRTKEGKIAPLRRVDFHKAFPKDIELKMRVHYTPTFVLLNDGQEVGRIEGYPGEDFFWGLLGLLLDKLPEQGSEVSLETNTLGAQGIYERAGG